MRKLSSAFAALSLLASPVIAADSQQPIGLETVHHADSVDIKVVEQAPVERDYSFRLEVASEGRGGTTNTVQRGTSGPGGPGGTLLQSRISTSELKGWTARLHVSSAAGDYSISRSN